MGWPLPSDDFINKIVQDLKQSLFLGFGIIILFQAAAVYLLYEILCQGRHMKKGDVSRDQGDWERLVGEAVSEEIRRVRKADGVKNGRGMRKLKGRRRGCRVVYWEE
jgi:hypothetical protein